MKSLGLAVEKCWTDTEFRGRKQYIYAYEETNLKSSSYWSGQVYDRTELETRFLEF